MASPRSFPEADAKQQGSPVVTGGGAGSGDRLVTSVYALKYESAAQLVNILRPLITPNNAIAALPSANALVITDYAENLRRIDKIIASLDAPPASEPMVVTLRYASALDVVQILNRLLAEVGADGGRWRPIRNNASRSWRTRARTACWCAPRMPRAWRGCAR